MYSIAKHVCMDDGNIDSLHLQLIKRIQKSLRVRLTQGKLMMIKINLLASSQVVRIQNKPKHTEIS